MVKRLSITTLFALGLLMSAPTHAAPCVAEPHTETDTPITYSTEIALSEIYPVPGDDEEEFIELYNASDDAVDLSGWMLSDASNKTYIINAEQFVSTVIDAGDYFVVPHSISKIYLNNGGDSVALHNPNAESVDSTEYSSGDSETAWVFDSGEWQWTTTATEGESNVLTSDGAEEAAETEPASGSGDTEEEVASEAEEIIVETSDQIVLSEMLPNPSGLDTTDEWIELYNKGDEYVSLHSWQLTDQSTYYTITEVAIAPGEYIVFEVTDTKISLNNSGDSLFLIDPFNTIIHGTEYSDPEEAQSWNYSIENGDWYWSESLTPSEANAEKVTESIESEDTTEASSAEESENESEAETAPDDIDSVDIALFKELDDATSATITGVVNVLPGTFGSQYFYMQDETAGVQVYSHGKHFPDFAIGDTVQVTGEKSTARGENRIKVTEESQIVVRSSDSVLIPRDTDNPDETVEGMLVQVEGEVVESSASEALIDDLIQIVLKKNAGIDKALLEEGSNTAVVGIVTRSNDQFRVQPRNNDDIQAADGDEIAFVQPAEAAQVNPDSLSAESAAKSPANSWMLAALLFVGAGGAGWYRWKQLDISTANGTTKSSKAVEENTAPSQTPPSIFEQLRNKL